MRRMLYVDLCSLLEMVGECLHVLYGLFALRISDVRGSEARVAFYLCSYGSWVMGIEELVDCIVVSGV